MVVVLLRGVHSRSTRAAFLPQVLVFLADPVQLALQLLDAPPLRLQKLGLALDDVVELQEVLDRPVGALWAGLHDGSLSSRGYEHSQQQLVTPWGRDPPPPPAPMSWGEGGTDGGSFED